MRRAAAALLVALTAAGGAGARTLAGPELDYVLHCLGCHLEDGSGAPDRGVPSLAGIGRFLRAPGGRAYLVRVPGVAHAPLDDAAVAALLNWMLARFDPARASAPDFVPYRPEEVRRLRDAPLLHAAARRRELLEALGAPATERASAP